ncbi:MAG TPA: FtsX-like permease family protein, partial [Vicinamibacterales bacterium]|nr:FtsX-like permease family protein [Vicinamibacterales bacterium]
QSTAILLGMFAAAALLLGAVGVYGIAAFSVAQRTRELGIRVAIGAAPRDVVRLVVAHVLVLALAGVVAGLAVSMALARAVASQLYEVSATDPGTLAFAAAALLLVALGAAWLPARRAARVDPLAAIRCE